jgi:PA26 p53-induced protein (sestrin)
VGAQEFSRAGKTSAFGRLLSSQFNDELSSAAPFTSTVRFSDVVEPEVGVDTLLERMRSMSEREEEFSIEEQTKRFLHVESDKAIELSSTPLQSQPTDISRFVEDPKFVYQDFQRRGEPADISTFRVQVRIF